MAISNASMAELSKSFGRSRGFSMREGFPTANGTAEAHMIQSFFSNPSFFKRLGTDEKRSYADTASTAEFKNNNSVVPTYLLSKSFGTSTTSDRNYGPMNTGTNNSSVDALSNAANLLLNLNGSMTISRARANTILGKSFAGVEALLRAQQAEAEAKRRTEITEIEMFTVHRFLFPSHAEAQKFISAIKSFTNPNIVDDRSELPISVRRAIVDGMKKERDDILRKRREKKEAIAAAEEVRRIRKEEKRLAILNQSSFNAFGSANGSFIVNGSIRGGGESFFESSSREPPLSISSRSGGRATTFSKMSVASDSRRSGHKRIGGGPLALRSEDGNEGSAIGSDFGGSEWGGDQTTTVPYFSSTQDFSSTSNGVEAEAAGRSSDNPLSRGGARPLSPPLGASMRSTVIPNNNNNTEEASLEKSHLAAVEEGEQEAAEVSAMLCEMAHKAAKERRNAGGFGFGGIHSVSGNGPSTAANWTAATPSSRRGDDDLHPGTENSDNARTTAGNNGKGAEEGQKGALYPSFSLAPHFEHVQWSASQRRAEAQRADRERAAEVQRLAAADARHMQQLRSRRMRPVIDHSGNVTFVDDDSATASTSNTATTTTRGGVLGMGDRVEKEGGGSNANSDSYVDGTAARLIAGDTFGLRFADRDAYGDVVPTATVDAKAIEDLRRRAQLSAMQRSAGIAEANERAMAALPQSPASPQPKSKGQQRARSKSAPRGSAASPPTRNTSPIAARTIINNSKRFDPSTDTLTALNGTDAFVDPTSGRVDLRALAASIPSGADANSRTHTNGNGNEAARIADRIVMQTPYPHFYPKLGSLDHGQHKYTLLTDRQERAEYESFTKPQIMHALGEAFGDVLEGRRWSEQQREIDQTAKMIEEERRLAMAQRTTGTNVTPDHKQASPASLPNTGPHGGGSSSSFSAVPQSAAVGDVSNNNVASSPALSPSAMYERRRSAASVARSVGGRSVNTATASIFAVSNASVAGDDSDRISVSEASLSLASLGADSPHRRGTLPPSAHHQQRPTDSDHEEGDKVAQPSQQQQQQHHSPLSPEARHNHQSAGSLGLPQSNAQTTNAAAASLHTNTSTQQQQTKAAAAAAVACTEAWRRNVVERPDHIAAAEVISRLRSQVGGLSAAAKPIHAPAGRARMAAGGALAEGGVRSATNTAPRPATDPSSPYYLAAQTILGGRPLLARPSSNDGNTTTEGRRAYYHAGDEGVPMHSIGTYPQNSANQRNQEVHVSAPPAVGIAHLAEDAVRRQVFDRMRLSGEAVLDASYANRLTVPAWEGLYPSERSMLRSGGGVGNGLSSNALLPLAHTFGGAAPPIVPAALPPQNTLTSARPLWMTENVSASPIRTTNERFEREAAADAQLRRALVMVPPPPMPI